MLKQDNPIIRFPNGDVYYKRVEYSKAYKTITYFLKVGDTEVKHRKAHPAVLKWRGKSGLSVEFWFKGELHRDNGPAIINYLKKNGSFQKTSEKWFMDGVELSDDEAKHKLKTIIRKRKMAKMGFFK